LEDDVALATVRIRVLNDTDGQPIAGVVVRVFDETGTSFVSSAITDVAGIADFTLTDGTIYSMRFFMERVSFRQPQLCAVEYAPAVNEFTVNAHVYEPPEAIHPRMCCCSGFFKGPDNEPIFHSAIHFIPKFDPILFEGSAVLKERVIRYTDESGFARVDLVRFGQYEVTIEGLEDQQRVITIPDAPRVNLPDLLFAVVDRIEFDPPGPWIIGVGAELEITITPTVHTSDGRTLPGSSIEDVYWRTDDSNVAAVLATASAIILRGISPGATKLNPIRQDQSIIRIPNPPIQGTPVDIIVV
jgi:hypothetical protein